MIYPKIFRMHPGFDGAEIGRTHIRKPCTIRKTADILFEIVRNRVLIADRYGDDGQKANHKPTRWESDDSCGSNWLMLSVGHG